MLFSYLAFFYSDAKRTLPRPKVGDFCTRAMEQGFSDACVALCMDEKPVARVAQACRSAAIEMPRPTIRRWCEHGYNVAYEKTVKDLKTHFKSDNRQAPVYNEPEPVREPEPEPEPEAVSEPENTEATETEQQQQQQQRQRESSLRGGTRNVLATIPITIGDETKDLIVHEGQNAEDAVVVFCRENVPEDVSSCIRQLLPTVIEKMEA